LLFVLVALDILSTNPTIEGNPLTLYLWAQFGILTSAWIKRIAKPNEWITSKKILLGLTKILVAIYIFVVSWNITLSLIF
jgi:hypothetical protein